MVPHSGWKEGERKGRNQGPTVHFKSTETGRLLTRLHLLQFLLTSNSAKLGTKPSVHGPVGDTPDINCSIK